VRCYLELSARLHSRFRGCRFCYAESIAYRFSGVGQPYEGLAVLKNGHASWTGKIEFIEKHLNDPIKWTKPRRIFVNSMSDVFHETRVHGLVWSDDERDEKVPSAHFPNPHKAAQENAGVCERLLRNARD